MIKVSCYTLFKRYPLPWLREALHGVISQTYPNIEYIFVIYGHDNDINGIIKELEILNGNFKLYYMLENESFTHAIKYAVSKCTGEFVIRCDGEDILLPNSIEIMVNALNDSDMIIPNYMSMDNYGNIIDENCSGTLYNISSNCLIRKNVVENTKFHEFQSCRDGYAILKHMEKNELKLTYLDIPLFRYRLNPEGITLNTRTNDSKKFSELLVDNMYKYNLDTDEIFIENNDKFLITSKRTIKKD